MFKNTLVAIGIAGILVFTGGALARPAEAQSTAADVNLQIQQLLSKISELTNQLNVLRGLSTTPASSVAASPARMRVCDVLNRNLSRGVHGDDVVSLQEFLQSGGYFNGSATGYFGPATASAVARWQSAEGISAIGSFGPMSRERMRIWCLSGQGSGNTSSGSLSATPQSGTAPLTVNFTANVTLANPQLVADAGDYKIVFGDGSEQVLSCTSGTGTCHGPHTLSHTYHANGSYTATLVHYGYFGPPQPNGGFPQQTVGKVTITVGTIGEGHFSASPQSGNAPLFVEFAYQPTEDGGQYYIEFGDGVAQKMDFRQIYCITTPCISPHVASHTYASAGTYNATVSRYIACLYSNPRCLIAQPPPLAQLQIVVGGQSSGNRPPVISGFSGPTMLTLNEQGTWTIQASDPENGSLTYAILWGDEWFANDMYPRSSAASSIVQSSTFTHSYSRAGTYTVNITVRDSAGLEAKTTATVYIENSQVACTKEYRPVCGRPAGCANTCAPGMYCTAICRLYEPQTYGNRCELNAAGAQFLYEGACDGRSINY